MPIKNYEMNLSEQERVLVEYLQKYNKITTGKAEEILGVKQRRSREILKGLVEKEVVLKYDAYKSTVYVLNEKENG